MDILVLYRLCQRGLFVYLRTVRPSVCHSDISFPDFSLVNGNLTYGISMSYRSSLSFVTLDLLLTEIFPLMFAFSFPDSFFFFFFFCLGWSEESEFFFRWLHSWIVIDQVWVSVQLTLFNWIMALDKLRYSVVWLITRKLFGVESSNLIIWCILTKRCVLP
jgi:hypothetical protein